MDQKPDDSSLKLLEEYVKIQQAKAVQNELLVIQKGQADSLKNLAQSLVALVKLLDEQSKKINEIYDLLSATVEDSARKSSSYRA